LAIFAAVGEIKIISREKLNLMIARLSHELIESHRKFSNTVIIGLQPRGSHLAKLIHSYLENYLKTEIKFGLLDTTFYRDDFRRRDEVLLPHKTTLHFGVEGKRVVLIDDVLYTGRSVRAGMDALVDIGRPEKVELLVLIDRLYSRHFPIEADYRGLSVQSIESQKVRVSLEADSQERGVWMVST
jgi:pyrimidine operon attenuation protein/uracil phosphoribosyltransferase